MASGELIDARVPIREGEYGARVVAVEPGGVEFIPLRERHGRPLKLFWTWMSPNLEFATVFVGALPILLFGGSFWTAVAAVLIGSALGSITHGILSSWGPRLGVPQMVQARAAFGYLGTLLPAGLNTITASIGWFAVNSVSGALALSVLPSLLGLPALAPLIALVIIMAAQVTVAYFGHNLVHQFERYAFPFLGIVFGLATLVILAKTNPGMGFNPRASLAFGGESGAFIIGAMGAFGYAAGWNPYASDYARYLPPSSNPWRVGLAAGLGVFVSCAVLELAGAGLATFASADGLLSNPTAQFVAPLPKVLAVLATLAIALGAVAANAINIYSGAMSFLTLGIKLQLKLRRAIVALAAGILGFVVAAFGLNGLAAKYTDFLLLIVYWISPYLAVVLTDYWMRRGEYDEAVFYDPQYRPWQGPVAMLAGIAASVPFWNQTLYVGWVANTYPQVGDLSFIVGFIVAAAVYYVLARATRAAVVAR